MREQAKGHVYLSYSQFVDNGETNRRDVSYSREWAGATLPEALELARKGWPEGAMRVQAIAAHLTAKIYASMSAPNMQYDVTGIDYDMGKYLAGEPENWYYFPDVQGTAKQVHMVVNYGVSSGIDKSIIETRGAIAAALLFALEASGIRVTVDAVAGEDWQGEDFLWVHLKDADQQLDIDRMAFALVHPAFLRYLFHGQHNSISPSDPKKEMQGDVYIGAGHLMDAQWQDEKLATEWILEQLKTQGVQFNSEEKTYA